MSEKTNQKPVNCGCGGKAKVEGHLFDSKYSYWDVTCKRCGISTDAIASEAEAIEAWNRAMSGSAEEKLKAFWDGMSAEMKEERTAKVIDKSVGRHSISDFDWTGKCEKCGNEIQYAFDYCPSCDG